VNLRFKHSLVGPGVNGQGLKYISGHLAKYYNQHGQHNQQPTTNNQQPTTNNQQPTTNNQQPTTNNQQPTTNTINTVGQVYIGLG
jgi:hypothetical protein